MAKTTLPPKDTNVLIRIDAKLKARLVKAAAKEGRTLSDFIRRTLEEKLSATT
ncbi:MAG: ribbon-helix-helix protein, CopG family [Flavobacteriales bacterium]|nr:ribbon-helix-helix protein, CopG family [Flavobacteriales bacterium]